MMTHLNPTALISLRLISNTTQISVCSGELGHGHGCGHRVIKKGGEEQNEEAKRWNCPGRWLQG
jgi:hypothetical protein